MIVREENLEHISRIIGDYYSGGPLSEKLKKIGVPENIVIYPNTKWRMVFDVMCYCSSLKDENTALRLLGKIIELVVHPLNFATGSMDNSAKLVTDFNKRLAFDKVAIKEIDGEFRLVKISTQTETKTSTDYITGAINYFKDEYNKVRLSGLSYEYELGTNEDSLLFMYEPDDVWNEISETRGKTKAIEQLAKVGFIKEYTIEQKSKSDDPLSFDYAVCTIDESKLTQKEEPVATDFGAEAIAQKVIKHEHIHRFENSIQEKDMVLNHKYEGDKPKTFYITKKGDDFYYNGLHILSSKENTDYYKVFCALYAKLPEGGKISYQDLITEIKSRMPEHKNKNAEQMQKFIQSNLTDKSNGFVRYAKIPNTESNGKPLIEAIRAFGLHFNNVKG